MQGHHGIIIVLRTKRLNHTHYTCLLISNPRIEPAVHSNKQTT